MRIWHQSFTVLDDVPNYRDALKRHLLSVASSGTELELHGMKPGTYPSDYPGSHIGYAYLSGLHKEQFVQALLTAEKEGYDAFLIGTIPDTGFEECRSLVDLPVIAYGQTSALMAASLGDRVAIINFIEALDPQIRRNMRNYGLDHIVGPITQIDATFQDVMAAYLDPEPLLNAFSSAAKRVIAEGANVIIPGEGPLNIFLADQGISRIDDVPVIDSLGTCLSIAELRVNQYNRSGLKPARRGFYYDKPAPDLVRAVRAWYMPRSTLGSED